jgi:hypothetical protein
MPNKAQPVPPIYQPEVAARAILFASKHKRREIFVGLSTVIAIEGNKLLPGLGDFYLGKTGVESQQTGEKDDPDKPNNLYEPVAGDPGAHGAFDARATRSSLELWTDLHRDWVVGGVLACAVVLLGAVLTGNRSQSR